MRVLLTSGSFDPSYGGPAVSVPGLARGLQQLGVEVVLWAEDGSCPMSEEGLPSLPCASGSIGQTVDEFQPTLVHDNGLWRPYSHRLASIADLKGIPRIVTLRGMLEPWAFRHRNWRKRAAFWLYQKRDLERASLIHATSRMEVDNLAEFSLSPRIVVVPNAAQIPTVGLVDKQQPRIILFLSRLHPKKGLPLLLEAFAKMDPDGWKLVIAGPDETGCTADMKKLAARLNISSKVEFSGPVYGDAKEKLISTSSLFVLPSYSENFGMVVAEALAHGVPVITTTGTPWIELTERHCGWWVEPAVSPISDALRQAIELPANSLASMGSNGRALVSEKYSWEVVARQILGVYQELVG